jgi:hypothetical protein
MQIGHCAAAASSLPEAIEFTPQAQLSADDAFVPGDLPAVSNSFRSPSLFPRL